MTRQSAWTPLFNLRLSHGFQITWVAILVSPGVIQAQEFACPSNSTADVTCAIPSGVQTSGTYVYYQAPGNVQDEVGEDAGDYTLTNNADIDPATSTSGADQFAALGVISRGGPGYEGSNNHDVTATGDGGDVVIENFGTLVLEDLKFNTRRQSGEMRARSSICRGFGTIRASSTGFTASPTGRRAGTRPTKRSAAATAVAPVTGVTRR